jgi:hypothetical protein
MYTHLYAWTVDIPVVHPGKGAAALVKLEGSEQKMRAVEGVHKIWRERRALLLLVNRVASVEGGREGDSGENELNVVFYMRSMIYLAGKS